MITNKKKLAILTVFCIGIAKVFSCPTPEPVFVRDTLNVCAGKIAVGSNRFEIINTGNKYNNFRWYDSELGATPISSLNGLLSYSVPFTTTSKLWVSQQGDDGTGSGQTCESPRKMIVFQVNPMPVVSLSVPADLCLTSGNTVELQGAATVNGTADNLGSGYFSHKSTQVGYERLNANILKVSYANDTIGKATTFFSDEVTFIYTTKFGCTDSASKTVTTHHVKQPSVDKVELMRRDIYQAVTLRATSKDAFGLVKWSAQYNMSNAIAEGTGYNTGLTNTSPTGIYLFYATQSITYGTVTCTSLPQKDTVIIYNCPVQKPTITANVTAICVYDNLPSDWVATTGGRSVGFAAGKPIGAGSNPADSSVFRLYAVNPATNPTSTEYTLSLSQYFDENANGAVNGRLLIPLNPRNVKYGSYTFYLVEYDKKYNCFGPAQKIELTVSKRMSPNVVFSQPICAEAAVRENKGPVITVTDRSTDKLLVYKSSTAPSLISSPLASINADSYTTNELSAGTYTYWVAYDNGCISDPTKVDVTVQSIPDLPIVTKAQSCQYQPLMSLSAASSSTVLWYKTNSKANDDLYGLTPDVTGTTYTPNASIASVAGTYRFYVRAKSTYGCVSDPVEVPYTILPQPSAPILLTSSINYCAMSALGKVTAVSYSESYGFFTWMVNDVEVPNYRGDNLQLEASYLQLNKNSVKAKFTANDTGCPTGYANQDIWINPVPEKPSIANMNSAGVVLVCEDNEAALTALGVTSTCHWEVFHVDDSKSIRFSDVINGNGEVIQSKTEYEELTGNSVIVRQRPQIDSRYAFTLVAYNTYIQDGSKMECLAPPVEGYIKIVSSGNCVTSSAEVLVEKPELFPNPCKDQLVCKFSINKLQSVQVSVLTTLGIPCIQETVLPQSLQTSKTIDVSQLPAGEYQVQIKTAESTITQKFVKQ